MKLEGYIFEFSVGCASRQSSLSFAEINCKMHEPSTQCLKLCSAIINVLKYKFVKTKPSMLVTKLKLLKILSSLTLMQTISAARTLGRCLEPTQPQSPLHSDSRSSELIDVPSGTEMNSHDSESTNEIAVATDEEIQAFSVLGTKLVDEFKKAASNVKSKEFIIIDKLYIFENIINEFIHFSPEITGQMDPKGRNCWVLYFEFSCDPVGLEHDFRSFVETIYSKGIIETPYAEDIQNSIKVIAEASEELKKAKDELCCIRNKIIDMWNGYYHIRCVGPLTDRGKNYDNEMRNYSDNDWFVIMAETKLKLTIANTKKPMKYQKMDS